MAAETTGAASSNARVVFFFSHGFLFFSRCDVELVPAGFSDLRRFTSWRPLALTCSSPERRFRCPIQSRLRLPQSAPGPTISCGVEAGNGCSTCVEDSTLACRSLTQLLAPSLPRVDNGVAIALGHALETMPPPLRTALTAAIQSRTPHAVVLDTLHLHCFPLAVDRAVVGVLVAAREGLSGADTERTRGSSSSSDRRCRARDRALGRRFDCRRQRRPRACLRACASAVRAVDRAVRSRGDDGLCRGTSRVARRRSCGATSRPQGMTIGSM